MTDARTETALRPTTGKLCGYTWSAYCYDGIPEIELYLGTDGWEGCGHSDLTISRDDLDAMAAGMEQAHAGWAARP